VYAIRLRIFWVNAACMLNLVACWMHAACMLNKLACVQSPVFPPAERATATEPPPTATASGSCSQGEMYDAYVADQERTRAAEEASRARAAAARKAWPRHPNLLPPLCAGPRPVAEYCLTQLGPRQVVEACLTQLGRTYLALQHQCTLGQSMLQA